MAIALRPPSRDALEELATMTPEETLGRPLNRQIAARAAATALGASSAWLVARLTGTTARARTVALAALVGSQLGQTLRSGGSSRPVVVTSLLSTAALVTVIQTPGLSHFFGCRPLGPLGWGTAVVASIAATRFASAAAQMLTRDVLTPLRLAERWKDSSADDSSWYADHSSVPPTRAHVPSTAPLNDSVPVSHHSAPPNDAVWDEATRHGVVSNGVAQARDDAESAARAAPDSRAPDTAAAETRPGSMPPDQKSADAPPNGDTSGDTSGENVLQGVFVDGAD
jgi:hypothetical protein